MMFWLAGLRLFHQNQHRASYQRPAHVDDGGAILYRAGMSIRNEIQVLHNFFQRSAFMPLQEVAHRPAQTAMFDASPAL